MVTLLTLSAPSSFAAATVGANWGYMAPGNSSGSLNPEVFSGDMSSRSSSYTRSSAVSNISVTASNGEIHLLNTYNVPEGGTYYFASAQVGGGFEDTIIISDPLRNGQTGTYVGSFRVDLSYHAENASFGINLFGVGVGSTLANARSASLNSFHNNGGITTYEYVGFAEQGVGSIDGIYNFSVPFTFGTSFGIAVWMESHISTGGVTKAGQVMEHDASHTVNWAGTVSVMDNDVQGGDQGTFLAPGSYGFSSGSGTDYAGPIGVVPEPSIVSLFAMGGIAFLTFCTVRRRSRSQS